MAQEEPTEETDPPKKSKMPMIIGLSLALVGGGGGFFAAWSGMILGGSEAETEVAQEEVKDPYGDIAFIEMDQMTISINATPQDRFLRFRAQLEVPNGHKENVTKVMPRVVDVLNSYLRALEVTDFESQAALTRLRAQMLRRVQIVTGEGHVNDLLIMEFVLT
ncbi:flagellar basal body-associated FliL family protein [Sulfitobacter donghicola]|uniref:Flagellar protein FliL n=1 Tax=Sulfitobacter donghicola DSW-25 = KCTC 12864 = JCM 14565 TaxID=1300350 RepID=A0A073IM45_9RHOB|nr:flagellar basal body-associated FliL family protein [Sulfitobacter donghicola]KEJ90541.1 flagellar basal body protein FliL [Sulfitobacter donghicola DSW-25 = KCTC 12864 = JCM 14565]KIN67784.1 Flagellar basal body-associated protein FliL [Sulfitobacter donghicola DSW-25 = KCTC 12864 = JCM 14565]